MQPRWKAALGGAAVATSVVLATLAVPALAQGPGQGPGGGPGPRAPFGELQPVSDLLGLTPEALRAELRAGNSLADVATAHGVDQATLTRTIQQAARTRLDTAVADGRLPAERADAMYQRLTQNIGQWITATPPSGGPAARGPRGASGPDGQGGPRFGRGPDGQGNQGGPRQGRGFGGWGFGRWLGGPDANGRTALASALNMAPDELRAERRSGKSLADIATARGVDQAVLIRTITDSARTRLDAAVADNRINQAQATALLGVVQAFAPDMINRSGPAAGARQGHGPGRGQRDGQGPGQRPGRGPGGTPPATPGAQ